MNGPAPAGARQADSYLIELPGTGGNGFGRPKANVSNRATPIPTLVPLMNAGAGGPSSDVMVDDWNDLFRAVQARLESSVGELPAMLPEPGGPSSSERLRASVLECVAALDQLRWTATNELGRRQRAEFDLFAARIALAQVQAELAGLRGEHELEQGLAQPPPRP